MRAAPPSHAVPDALFDASFDVHARGARLVQRAITGLPITPDYSVLDHYDLFLLAAALPLPVRLEDALGVVDVALTLDDERRESTKNQYRRLIARMIGSALAYGLTNVEDLRPEWIDRFLAEATFKRGVFADPDEGTINNRRTAMRYFFRALRRNGIDLIDPTIDVKTPPRQSSRIRPLVDDEMERVEWAAFHSLVPTARPVAVALAQTGAATLEIASVYGRDVDLANGTVRLPGSTLTRPRTNELTHWARMTLAQRLEHLAVTDDPDERPLVVGRSVTAESASAIVSSKLRDALNVAGVIGGGIDPTSIAAWRAMKIFEQRERLDDAANFLGMRSLDRTARILGVDWQS